MVDIKKHILVGLGYFLLVAVLGLFLRLFFIADLPATFRFIVHTHSHIALLGWVFVAVTGIIYHLFLKDAGIVRLYRRLFWLAQICILGMLFSFPFQGYAMFSIIFSTLFLIVSYFYAWFFIKYIPERFKNTASWKCIKASLYYMVISSIGPWALGAIMTTLGKTSIWYKLSIYFYLHFQYNGWFIMALCGFLLYYLESNNLNLKPSHFKRFFLSVNLGIILSFFLSCLWLKPSVVIYLLAGAGAVVQVAAFYWFFDMIRPTLEQLKSLSGDFGFKLLRIAGIFLMLKILMQLLSAIPYFAELAYKTHDFIIGYLHWTFLGVISLALLVFLHFWRLIALSPLLMRLYLLAFIGSEALLFYRGLSVWLGLPMLENFHLYIFLFSALFPVSLSGIFIRNLSGRSFA
ncbi:hypothetical protein [Salegentibacter chungangensis]|uniref:NnrS family protein n=1 Tax=Salegentibacter chungangensis TaxID=1335724 RepID=A0ABW3NRI7_9FLAO